MYASTNATCSSLLGDGSQPLNDVEIQRTLSVSGSFGLKQRAKSHRFGHRVRPAPNASNLHREFSLAVLFADAPPAQPPSKTYATKVQKVMPITATMTEII